MMHPSLSFSLSFSLFLALFLSHSLSLSLSVSLNSSLTNRTDQQAPSLRRNQLPLKQPSTQSTRCSLDLIRLETVRADQVDPTMPTPLPMELFPKRICPSGNQWSPWMWENGTGWETVTWVNFSVRFLLDFKGYYTMYFAIMTGSCFYPMYFMATY